MNHGRNLFVQLVNSNIAKHENITKADTGKGNSYTTGFLFDNL